jgi:hypothetical protein
MPLLTNATVSLTRNGLPVPTSTHVRVLIAAPRPENINPEGVQVSTTILADPGSSWRTGDIMSVEALDGFGDLDQITKSDVLSAQRHAGLLPVIRVFVRGTLQ